MVKVLDEVGLETSEHLFGGVPLRGSASEPRTSSCVARPMARLRSLPSYRKMRPSLGAVSSAGERLPYTQDVGGSNPSPPTKLSFF